MPQYSSGGRSHGAADTSIQLKLAVITLRIFPKLEYAEIEAKTGVQASTACRIFNKAKDDAGNDDFHHLLATLSPKSARPGRDPLVQNGSKASAAIREDILTFPRYAMEDASAGAVNAAASVPRLDLR